MAAHNQNIVHTNAPAAMRAEITDNLVYPTLISSSSSVSFNSICAEPYVSATFEPEVVLNLPSNSTHSSNNPEIDDVNRNLYNGQCESTAAETAPIFFTFPQTNDDVQLNPAPISDLSLDRISIQSFESPSTRSTFLRKVLAIVGLQLLFVAVWSLLCIHVAELGKFVHNEYWITFIALALYLSLYFAVGLLKLGRSYPSNIVILTIFTASLAYICGYVTMQYSTWIVLLTIGATVVTCLALILMSLITKIDVTGWGMYLTLAGCLFMGYVTVVFICSFVLKDLHALSILNITGAFVGACLVSMYLLFDLQMIIGGRRAQIDADQWLFAAMSLFYDIIMIFVYLLQIIGLLRRCNSIHQVRR